MTPFDDHGMSLLELTIATALMTTMTAALFVLMHPADGAFAGESEVADVQQRLRVAIDSLSSDLMMAGAGPSSGRHAGPLIGHFAPVQPVRAGTTQDAVTLFSAASDAVHTTLSADLNPGATVMRVEDAANCPVGATLCGLTPGMQLLVYDDFGNADTFAVVGVADNFAQVQITSRAADAPRATYAAGSKVVEARVRTYSRRTEALPPSDRLMRGDAPVVDHLVGLTFELYGEPEPPTLTPEGPTYGPKPPLAAVKATGYPEGESCTFLIDPDTGMQVPRLATLNDTGDLELLTPSQLADGPWCPDDSDVNRWDADLLRIRKIAVTVRVEAAPLSLRGPSGPLFVNGGSSRRASAWIPDQQIRWTVAPRNLNLPR